MIAVTLAVVFLMLAVTVLGCWAVVLDAAFKQLQQRIHTLEELLTGS